MNQMMSGFVCLPGVSIKLNPTLSTRTNLIRHTLNQMLFGFVCLACVTLTCSQLVLDDVAEVRQICHKTPMYVKRDL